jgi:hypothetical protein
VQTQILPAALTENKAVIEQAAETGKVEQQQRKNIGRKHGA